MARLNFAQGEYYHIYNRGVEKRNILGDWKDSERLFQSMIEFNTKDPIGSIYENSFIKDEVKKKFDPLVEFIAYCINPNHYHFILTPLKEKGIQLFMHRLGIGYTLYFNTKYRRSGALFQGRFKARHISSNEYLLHASAYVNLNNKIHQLGDPISKLVRSSWEEYYNPKDQKNDSGFCAKEVILTQFRSVSEYEKFAHASLEDIVQRKSRDKGFQKILVD